MTAIATRMFDAQVRVEAMFWLPGIQCACPREFRDFIESDLADAKELLKQLPWLKTFLKNPDWQLEPDEWPVEFYRKGCNGFLVNLATPIPHDFTKDGRGHQFSWGHYQCRWVYFESLDALPDYAEGFRKEIIARELAKEKKSKRQKARA
jgi:hypothetical protein